LRAREVKKLVGGFGGMTSAFVRRYFYCPRGVFYCLFQRRSAWKSLGGEGGGKTLELTALRGAINPVSRTSLAVDHR